MAKGRQSRFGTLRAAVLLLAVLALVVSRSVTATAGLALPALSGHGPIDCAAHSDVVHPSGHHHDAAHAHASTPSQDHAGAHGKAMQGEHEDLPAFPDSMPCCATAAAIVIPMVESVPQPTATAGPAFGHTTSAVLKELVPEGPSEPPRTSDQG